MSKRTSLTPALGTVAPNGVHAMRRGGARREVTERVFLRVEGRLLEGWALNVSRGGLRAILEEKVELGAEFEIAVGSEEDALQRTGRVVWVQEEPDGVIVGLEFLTLSGSFAAAPAAPLPDGSDPSDAT